MQGGGQGRAGWGLRLVRRWDRASGARGVGGRGQLPGREAHGEGVSRWEEPGEMAREEDRDRQEAGGRGGPGGRSGGASRES